jgi:hypothetical protein
MEFVAIIPSVLDQEPTLSGGAKERLKTTERKSNGVHCLTCDRLAVGCGVHIDDSFFCSEECMIGYFEKMR